MNLAEFHFIRPYWLTAFIPYLAILAFMLRSKLARGNWSAVCDAALLPYLLQDKAVKQTRWPLAAGAFAALLAIIALAGPTWERLPAPVFRNDSALVIALDLSRSMDAEDIKPSRLIRARYKIADILKQRKDGQTALLVYAGDAFTVTPLTDDTETISNQLEALTTGIMPSQGSNADIVLKKAVDLFKQAGLQKGQIILLTDGADFDKTVAEVKVLENYSLSILAVGTADGAPIALPEGGFLKDEQDSIVVAKLNEPELKALAQVGNGVYQAITADDSDIQALLSAGNRPAAQQGQENPNVLLDQWSDKGPWLLLPVLPLAALMFRKGLLCLALMLILPIPKNGHAFEWRDLWQTKDQQGQQAYQQQQYNKAAQLFENPDWKAAAQYKSDQKDLEDMKPPKTATGFYNQGNVLAKAQRYEEAIKAYEKALDTNAKETHPNDRLEQDARYNKELVEKELEKQKQQQQNQQKNGQSQSSEQNPEQNKDQQNGKPEQSGEQQKSEQQAEQKPSESEQASESQQQSDKSKDNKGQEANETEQAGQQNRDEAKQPARQQTDRLAAHEQQSDETRQANEQWLNRIPDDPAGLLKRKFKYQYGQRQHPADRESGSW